MDKFYDGEQRVQIKEFYIKETLVVRPQDETGLPIVCRFLTTNNYVLETIGIDAPLAFTTLFKEQKVVLPDNDCRNRFRRFSMDEILDYTEPRSDDDF